MRLPSAVLVVGALAIAGLALAVPAAADHPADQVTLVVVDGPRHDLAFDPEGPMAPLYEAEDVTVANDTWTAGPAKTVPGHAALLTGSAQDIANDGSQRPEDPLVWEVLHEDRGWGAEQMRWLYEKDKLAALGGEHVGGGQVEAERSDEAMLDALEANRSDPHARLIVASFAWPDDTGHEGNWPAHRASLAAIADGVAPMLAEAGEDELVVVTSDHARYCAEPDDHGRLGPFAPVDECDAHVPLWVAGWHVRDGARVGACLTQADVGVLVARAAGTSFPDPGGRFPAPLIEANASWSSQGCPPERGGGPFGVPTGPGLAVAALAIASVALVRAGRR